MGNALINGATGETTPVAAPAPTMACPRMVWRKAVAEAPVSRVEVVNGQRIEWGIFDLPEGTPAPAGWGSREDALAPETAEKPAKKKTKQDEQSDNGDGN